MNSIEKINVERKKKKEKKIRQLLKQAAFSINAIEDLKEHYKALDSLVIELKKLGFTYCSKANIRLQDNFKASNVNFKTTSFKRFELKRD